MKVGTIVKFRSGSPLLTVVALSKENDTRVCCGWFNEAGNYASEWFHTDTLQTDRIKS